eukprot:2421679-Amphidinium_carterae.2
MAAGNSLGSSPLQFCVHFTARDPCVMLRLACLSRLRYQVSHCIMTRFGMHIYAQRSLTVINKGADRLATAKLRDHPSSHSSTWRMCWKPPKPCLDRSSFNVSDRSTQTHVVRLRLEHPRP